MALRLSGARLLASALRSAQHQQALTATVALSTVGRRAFSVEGTFGDKERAEEVKKEKKSEQMPPSPIVRLCISTRASFSFLGGPRVPHFSAPSCRGRLLLSPAGGIRAKEALPPSERDGFSLPLSPPEGDEPLVLSTFNLSTPDHPSKPRNQKKNFNSASTSARRTSACSASSSRKSRRRQTR